MGFTIIPCYSSNPGMDTNALSIAVQRWRCALYLVQNGSIALWQDKTSILTPKCKLFFFIITEKAGMAPFRTFHRFNLWSWICRLCLVGCNCWYVKARNRTFDVWLLPLQNTISLSVIMHVWLALDKKIDTNKCSISHIFFVPSNLEVILVLQGHKLSVRDLSFYAGNEGGEVDENHGAAYGALATVSFDRTIRVWNQMQKVRLEWQWLFQFSFCFIV